MIKFKVKTVDTLLFMNRVIVLEAVSKEELMKRIKVDFPNSKVVSIDEVTEEPSEY